MKNNTQVQLALLPLAELAPSIDGVFHVKELHDKDKKDAQGNPLLVGQTFTTMKRKDIAKALDLSTKTQGAEIDAAILRATDAMKPQLAGLASKLAADPSFTAGNVVIRNTKNGLKVNLQFKRVDRPVVKVSPADLAKSLIAQGMSKEEAIAEVTKAMEAEFAQLQATEVQAEVTSTETQP